MAAGRVPARRPERELSLPPGHRHEIVLAQGQGRLLAVLASLQHLEVVRRPRLCHVLRGVHREVSERAVVAQVRPDVRDAVRRREPHSPPGVKTVDRPREHVTTGAKHLARRSLLGRCRHHLHAKGPDGTVRGHLCPTEAHERLRPSRVGVTTLRVRSGCISRRRAPRSWIFCGATLAARRNRARVAAGPGVRPGACAGRVSRPADRRAPRDPPPRRRRRPRLVRDRRCARDRRARARARSTRAAPPPRSRTERARGYAGAVP